MTLTLTPAPVGAITLTAAAGVGLGFARFGTAEYGISNTQAGSTLTAAPSTTVTLTPA